MRRQSGFGVGVMSLLAVFVVLCLTTFAVLSLVSARSDRALSQKNADATTSYYAADAQAERQLQKLAEHMKAEDWKEAVQEAGFSLDVTDTARVSYAIALNEQQILQVEVEWALAHDRPTGIPYKRQWRVCTAIQ